MVSDPSEHWGSTPLGAFMGIEVVELSASRGVARMPIAPNVQPMGRLAGGASILLCEGIASRAANVHATTLGKIALGTEVNASHHRAARDGNVTATATALHLGRTVATYDVAVLDDGGARITSARVTCTLVKPTKESIAP